MTERLAISKGGFTSCAHVVQSPSVELTVGFEDLCPNVRKVREAGFVRTELDFPQEAYRYRLGRILQMKWWLTEL